MSSYNIFMCFLLFLHAFGHATAGLLICKSSNAWLCQRPIRKYIIASAMFMLFVSSMGGISAAFADARPDMYPPLLLGRIGGIILAYSLIAITWNDNKVDLLGSSVVNKVDSLKKKTQ